MCEPTTIAIAGSAALSMMGAAQQAKAAKNAGRADQQYYDYIAQQNQMQADEAIKVGAQKANQAQTKGSLDSAKYMRNASEFRGLQRATQAAMGMGAGSATAEDISTDTLNKEQLDQMAIRYNADLEAWSAKTGADYQAWDYRNQSTLNTMAGVNARRAGDERAKASMIGGATSVANSIFSYGLYKS